jgi:hypothetical protein
MDRDALSSASYRSASGDRSDGPGNHLDMRAIGRHCGAARRWRQPTWLVVVAGLLAVDVVLVLLMPPNPDAITAPAALVFNFRVRSLWIAQHPQDRRCNLSIQRASNQMRRRSL